MKKKLMPIWPAILSGVLIGTSYIPFPPWALFFCFIPLWRSWLQPQSPAQAFITGWWTQFLLTMIGFHWVAHTTVEFGHLPWFVGVLALIGFGLFAHLHIAIPGAIEQYFRARWSWGPFGSILIFVTLTWAFENSYPMIFPWNFGYPWLWAKMPAVQWADVFGFQVFSLFTLAINGALTAISLPQTKLRNKLALGGVILLFLAAINYTGLQRKEKWKPTSDGHALKVLIVQANIGNFEKYLAERIRDVRKPIIDTYMKLMNQAVPALSEPLHPPLDAALNRNPNIDLVVWPETAFPDVFDPPMMTMPYQTQVTQFLKMWRLNLMTGAYSEDNRQSKPYNAIFLLNSDGNVLSRYRKTVLLAFGEYIPGGDWFPFLKKIVPEISDFGRGSGPTVMTLGTHRFGTLICYEGLFPDFAAEITKQGAQILVNVTNDSWFGNAFEPRQHRIVTLARALEFRRPLIRSTNTGITSVMLADGTELESSPQNQEWTKLYQVPFLETPSHTFFESLARWIPWIGWLLSAIVISASWFIARGNPGARRDEST